MSLESRVVAVGRRIGASPLWTGLVITLFFILPTLVIPFIELWVSALLAVLIGPPIVVGCFLLYGIYRRFTGLFGTDDESEPDTAAEDDPIERLKQRYANGEIDDATFERHLEMIMRSEAVDEREPTPERIRNR